MKKGTLVVTGLFDYGKSWDLQRDLHKRRLAGSIPDTLLLTEHPHVYTLGKVAHEENLLCKEEELLLAGIEVYRIDRGGDVTYHGPGQIVGYPILDLREHYMDVQRFLRDLEEVLMRTLTDYDVKAGRIEGLTGVWVADQKIAAIGIKVSRWVTMHGFAFNVNTDLSYFGSIIPCGIADKTVTSLANVLGKDVDVMEVRTRIAGHFGTIFGLEFEQGDLSQFVRQHRGPVAGEVDRHGPSFLGR